MQNHRRQRPSVVTLLALGVLILTSLNGVRFVSAITTWDLLADLMLRPGPLYIAATGLTWTVGGLIVFLGLWLGLKWARFATLCFSGLYAAYYWLDRLIFQAAVPRANLSFVLIATFVLLIFTAVTVITPGSRKYFETKREI